ncbi:hypothetical protein ACYX7E_09900 [Luteimonas sp. RIT-PG2_3]
MADLMFPDIAGRFQQGQQLGLAQRLQGQGEQRRNRLAELAGQAYGATGGQRDAFVQQAVATDPEAGFALGGALQSNQDARTKELVNRARFLVNAPAEQRANFYQQMLPELQRMGIGEFPAQYDDSVEQTAQAIVKAYGSVGGASGVQSTFVNDQGQRVAIMRNGSTQILGGNDSGMSQQTVTINGPDGRPAQYTFDKRTGNYVPASLGGQSSAQGVPQPQVQQYGGMADVQYRTDDGQQIPPEEQAIAQQAMLAASRGQTFDMPVRPAGGNQLQTSRQVLPPALDYGRGGAQSPFVGRSPEEQAALTEAARLQAQLQYAPQQQAIETQGAIDRARQEAAVKAAADTAALDATRTRDSAGTLDLLKEAEALLGGATGSGAGAARDRAAGFFGVSTPGAQNTAALRTIAGQLTSKMPRMQGPQSDKDVQLYKEMAGDLANDVLPVGTRLAALRTIRTLNQKYAGHQETASPVRIQSASDYNSLPSGALFIAPDGTQRRKR